MASKKSEDGTTTINLDELLKRIDVDIKHVFSFGDKSGVSAKDLDKKVDNKTKLAELAYQLFKHVIDCRDSIKSMRSSYQDSRTISSKIASIERTMQQSTLRTNEALIEIKKSTELLQADIRNHQEEQKQIPDIIKSYSDALTSNSESKNEDTSSTIDMRKLQKVIKTSVAEANFQKERSCRVVLFGTKDIKEPEFDYVKKMLFNINADENSLVSVERIGRRPTDCLRPDTRPIRATFRDIVSARECLKQAPALKTEGYEKVYMSRDLSKRDQLKRREVVKELKAKIASQTDRYWVIKDGKVVDGGERKDRKAGEASIASPVKTRSSSRLLELKNNDRKLLE